MSRLRLPAAAAMLAVTGSAAAALAAPHHGHRKPAVACTGNPAKIHRLGLTVGGAKTFGFYAVPAKRAKGIVVFAHGYGHTAYSWIEHAEQVAKRDGVIAIAMDYHGQRDIPPVKGARLPSSRGWRVAEGAQDSI